MRRAISRQLYAPRGSSAPRIRGCRSRPPSRRARPSTRPARLPPRPRQIQRARAHRRAGRDARPPQAREVQLRAAPAEVVESEHLPGRVPAGEADGEAGADKARTSSHKDAPRRGGRVGSGGQGHRVGSVRRREIGLVGTTQFPTTRPRCSILGKREVKPAPAPLPTLRRALGTPNLMP